MKKQQSYHTKPRISTEGRINEQAHTYKQKQVTTLESPKTPKTGCQILFSIQLRPLKNSIPNSFKLSWKPTNSALKLSLPLFFKSSNWISSTNLQKGFQILLINLEVNGIELRTQQGFKNCECRLRTEKKIKKNVGQGKKKRAEKIEPVRQYESEDLFCTFFYLGIDLEFNSNEGCLVQ